MNEPNKEYIELVKKKMPKSKHLLTMFRAFWVGGLICCIGQGITDLYKHFFSELPEEEIATLTTITLICITVILTGFVIYIHSL